MARYGRLVSGGVTVWLAVLLLACSGCSGETAAGADSGGADADGGGVRFDGAVLDGTSGGDGEVLDGESGGDGAALDGSRIPQDAAFAVDQLARFIDICREWGDIVCNAIETCCAPDERGRTLEECLSSQDVGCGVVFSGEAFLDGRITFDLTAAAACNAELRTRAATCDPDASCSVGKFIAGTVPAGGDCTPIDPRPGVGGLDASALLSCAPGLYCDLTMDATGYHGVCRPLGGAGDVCSSRGQCRFESSLTCDAASGLDGVCVPLFPDGTACTDWSSCAGTYCDHGICTSTPHVRYCGP